MEQQEVKKSVENILNNSTGTMATVKTNKPHSRYMTFFNDNLKLYTATSKETDKTEEIDQNPYTHILLGYDGEGFGDSYVEYLGKVTIKNDESLKKDLWNEHMEHWFNGPEDPNFIVLEITPVEIRLMNKRGKTPATLEL
ncbi:general stress protein [Peribacillus cavernae]|uniref:General stress protein n=1 Tax=Peribacillus cavernae TaxID=1674310 RepID=A0A3S1B2S0_9BACI|nr:pyridoxamine 5'-phosphate oxidase family protein [Peribacillus cavernae]MDQ0220603.1 general stress protein 26 [Peribacillus cavernae]RUQ27338.1 general stress protein [Peribacillus cavernae]